MDTYFISHRSTKMSIDESNKARHFLQAWKCFPQSPKAILVISAHWDTYVPSVNAVQLNDTIYDFYGFPKPMYKIKYPAPGASELAKRVKELLLSGGFNRVDEDNKRGLNRSCGGSRRSWGGGRRRRVVVAGVGVVVAGAAVTVAGAAVALRAFSNFPFKHVRDTL